MDDIDQVKGLDGDIVMDSDRDELYKKYRSKFNKRAALFQHGEVTSKTRMVFNMVAGLAITVGAGFFLHETQFAIPMVNIMMGSSVIAGLAKAGFAVKPILDQRSYRRIKVEMDDLRAQINTAFPDTVWKEVLDIVDASGESLRVQMSFSGNLPFSPKVHVPSKTPPKDRQGSLISFSPV